MNMHKRRIIMALKIYNSLTNKIEEFIPKNKNTVNMYVCGPTVYNYIHIGNARPVIFFDTFKKYLEFKGLTVNYASNITDVDDKIINKAIEEGVTEKEITERYEKAYFEDVNRLGSEKPDFVPHATEYIPEMESFIKGLEDK
jgi:cysteinyl-tRNA synthetase